MNDFDALLVQVIAQAKALEIPVSDRIDPHVAVNRRAVSRFGCCRRSREGFRIELAEGLLRAEERACCQTLAHEVLHTCPGCQDHGPLWQAYAQRMNRAWGYRIARTGARDELGVEAPRSAPHLVVCQQCGRRFERFRASALVQHPERYRCRCGGVLYRVS